MARISCPGASALVQHPHVGHCRRAIFVDIVANMEPQVEIGPRGGVTIGIEPAVRQVRAREDAEPEAASIAHRQRPGAAHWRLAAVRRYEAVPIDGPGLEPVDRDLRSPVAPGAGLHAAARDRLCEIGVQRDFDLKPDRVIVGRGDIARPQQHRIRAGLAARHIVREALRAEDLLREAATQGRTSAPSPRPAPTIRLRRSILSAIRKCP